MSTLTITTVQTDINWLNVQDNLASLNTKLLDIAKTDLILLPETFATGFAINLDVAEEVNNGPVITWLLEQAKKHNCVIAGSVLVKNNNKKVNRFFWVWPDGTI